MPAPRLRFVMWHSFRDGVDLWVDYIRKAAASVHHVYPEAAIFLLSNLVPNLPDYVQVEQIEIRFEHLMLSRVRAYCAFLEAAEPEGYVIFLDPDVLLLKPVDEVLVNDFDFAFTLRNSAETPINVGFYIANMNAKESVCSMFRQYVASYEAQPEHTYFWTGEQRVLAQMLGAPSIGLRKTCSARWNGYRIKYLPRRIYNHTPSRTLLRLRLYRWGAKVLHFKDKRRKLAMESYFRRYVGLQ